MVNRSVCSLLLTAALFWPTRAYEVVSDFSFLRQPQRIESVAEIDYLKELSSRGVELWAQGIRVESLDGSLIYADHHGDRVFNPASVIKIATSLAALERFGPEHRFETSFYVDGEIGEKGVLDGDLILHSDGDPEMGTTDRVRLARQLLRAGLRRGNGELLIDGPFTVGNLHRSSRVASHLQRTLRRLGLRVPPEATYRDGLRGTRMAQRFSEPLRQILFYQNAHSSNSMADRLGTAVGGPKAVERYLETEVGIAPQDVTVQRASGLRNNRLTPAGMIILLRKMVRWLEAHDMAPEDILPIAGMDAGTLRRRFRARDHRGAVVAKTGTLVATDDGISTLAGILYTEDHGPVLFAIFNTHGPVLQYRRFQDAFVKDLLAEYGGIPLVNASSRRLGN